MRSVIGGKPMRTLTVILMIALSACSQPASQTATEQDDTANMILTATDAPPPTGDAAGGKPVDVPSDPNARYFLLSVKPGTGGRIEAITRREGKSGISYARREIDCSGQTFRYTGEGDTLDEAKKPAPNIGEMGDLVDGSISDVVVKFACSQ